jgi:threonyl-tRNA synthetase
MTQVRLPDGSTRDLAAGATAADLAAAIGPGLARAAVAAKVNGEIVDLSRALPDRADVALLTRKDPEALEVLRHSAAHLMADAILRLFPRAELTIGPVVEDGFYYDIYLPEGKITPDDFPRIEEEMARIAREDHPFQRCEVADPDRDENFARYRAIDGGHNKFKAEIVGDIRSRGDGISLYRHGDFVDLCRGPHVPSTGWLENVKLTSVAGSYWRADASREQLVRVYGTAFFDKKELKEHLRLIEEARKRDHRVLGEQLDLFSFHEEAPGFPFFHPNGTVLFHLLTDTMRGLLRRRGYLEVKAPLVLSEELWHTSGHYDNYLENMFFTKLKLRDACHPEEVHDDVEEDRPMAVKPMNCPGHLLVYRTRPRSHNEFPLRFSEMGLVHRRELSGVRHGLFRVQAFTQDDAHHFCTPEQIENEIAMLIAFFRRCTRSSTCTMCGSSCRRGPRRASGATRSGRRRSRHCAERSIRTDRVHDQRRRRRVLRAEDRLPHPRRAEALVAVRHDPARLLDARALRPQLHRTGRAEAHAGDDPPRVLRQHRALPRDPDRALRGPLPAVAGTRSGDRHPRLRQVRRLRAERARAAARTRVCAPRRT